MYITNICLDRLHLPTRNYARETSQIIHAIFNDTAGFKKVYSDLAYPELS